ncbi:hypothetical protein D5F92_04630 [Streptococcus agalactiae]|nr:hypothetical protein D5F92_04630 [Streptococcus agalactiae]
MGLVINTFCPIALKKFPLYCPKCRQENLIEIKQFKVTVITEPDAKTQSR